MGDWGLGIGDWGLGIGAQSPYFIFYSNFKFKNLNYNKK